MVTAPSQTLNLTQDHTCTAESAEQASSSGGSPTALEERMPRACGEFLRRCTYISRGIVSAPARTPTSFRIECQGNGACAAVSKAEHPGQSRRRV